MLKRGIHQFYAASSGRRHRLVTGAAGAAAATSSSAGLVRICVLRHHSRVVQLAQPQLQQQRNHDYEYDTTCRLTTTTVRFFSSTRGDGGDDDKKKGIGGSNSNMPSLESIMQSLDDMYPKQQHQHEEEAKQQASSSRPIMEMEESYFSSFAAAAAADDDPPPPTTANKARPQQQQQQQQSYRTPYSDYSSSSSSSPYSSSNTTTAQQQQQPQTIDWSKKVGRGWTDPLDPLELLEASLTAGNKQQQPGSSSSLFSSSSARSLTYDDLPDWSPEHVSRAALDRVRVHDDKIPSLEALSKLPLPPPPAYPQPGLYPGQYVALFGLKDDEDHRDKAEQIQKQHTRNKRLYGRHREQHLYQQVQQKVKLLAEPQIPAIVALHDWHDKQNAIDDLFESIELQLQQTEVILGKHPSLGKWVERALEEYLASLVAAATAASPTAATVSSTGGGQDDDESSKNSNFNVSDNLYPTPQEDAAAVPVFMDCQDGDTNSAPVSSSKSNKSSGSSSSSVDIFPVPILRPLRPYERAANQGRMIEEWELAAHDTTKRILLRQSTRQVARILTEHYESTATTNNINNTTTNSTATNNDTDTVTDTDSSSSSDEDETPTITKTSSSSSSSPRILVTGRQGVGKTAALASIVASARKSGHVVWYMPDCNQLHQNGYYIEPSEKNNNNDERESKLYDLPILSQQVCRDLYASHGLDLQKHNLKASAATLQKFFTTEQLDHIPGASGNNNDDISIPLSDLLKLGLEKTSMGPMCLSTVIHVLMHEQDVVPFTIVVDEFNVLFAPGKYFHQDYDESVKNAIPYDQITLFRPILKAMGFPNSSINSNKTNDAVSMKRGAIVAGLTESCAVARQVTDTLVARAQHEASLLSSSSSSSLHVVDIPRLTDQEVYCMLANYEAIGIGKLRLDQGETILNPQEVAFLRTVSGSVPQLLMNACII